MLTSARLQCSAVSHQEKTNARCAGWIDIGLTNGEALVGWIKNVLGFRQFSLRGLEKVKAEFKLLCLALNLRRMSGLRAG